MSLFSTVTINEQEFRGLVEDIRHNLTILREKNDESQAALRQIGGYSEPISTLAKCQGATSARIQIVEDYVAKLEARAEVTEEEL